MRLPSLLFPLHSRNCSSFAKKRQQQPKPFSTRFFPFRDAAPYLVSHRCFQPPFSLPRAFRKRYPLNSCLYSRFALIN
ncbi:hypothetical protein VNO78_26900 [Psophocarpus tetragonolobus]|uniref:Uncharacterized protein n=1 Tax=Psophocarpus tetragonolobus TaxID=3891 RepID=A0AAN9S045_PSOTE